jgi:hypothetical protein
LGSRFRGISFHDDGLFVASHLLHARRFADSSDCFGSVHVVLRRRGFCACRLTMSEAVGKVLEGNSVRIQFLMLRTLMK